MCNLTFNLSVNEFADDAYAVNELSISQRMLELPVSAREGVEVIARIRCQIQRAN